MTDNVVERWLPIEGWPYEVSSLGNVRRITSVSYWPIGRLLRPSKKQRYLKVVLKQGGGRKWQVKVHKLVACAFHGPCPAGYTVNHKNTNKHDNSDTNLEYVTSQGNSDHAIKNGLMLRGEQLSIAKATEEQIKEIRTLRESGMTLREIAELFNLCSANVWNIINRRTWRHVS